MNLQHSQKPLALLLAAGAMLCLLSVVGCGDKEPPPMPAGVSRVDSTKPPPSMEQLKANADAAKSSSSDQK